MRDANGQGRRKAQTTRNISQNADVDVGSAVELAMMLQRLVLSVVSIAMQLGDACAFLPHSALPLASWREVASLTSRSSRHVPIQTSSRPKAAQCAVLRGGAANGLGAKMETAMSGGDDLYIVGAGYLGKLVGRQWLEKFPSAVVYAETRSSIRHDMLESEGLTPTLREAREETAIHCSNVVFCAALKGNDDYVSEVARAAAQVWDGSGMFVFTSSGGIYAESGGGTVNEESPVSNTPRATRLQAAEAASLAAGGCVVRLAGLYSVDRGPHNYWLLQREVDSSPHGLINLLAYEDAAGAVVAALVAARKKPPSADGANPVGGRVFLAADSVPTSRREICQLALDHPFHGWKKMPQFQEDNPDTGAKKVYDTSVTRRDLGWSPRYESMAEFMGSKMEEEKEAWEESENGRK